MGSVDWKAFPMEPKQADPAEEKKPNRYNSITGPPCIPAERDKDAAAN